MNTSAMKLNERYLSGRDEKFPRSKTDYKDDLHQRLP